MNPLIENCGSCIHWLSIFIQILLIAFFYYRWLRLMRNSAAIFAFSSYLFLICVLAVGSFLLQMPVLNAICRYLLLQVPLLFIILFQNDIRRGCTSFALWFRNAVADRIGLRREFKNEVMVSELVEAICMMTSKNAWRDHLKTIYNLPENRGRRLSSKNTGALIALQGYEDFEQFLTDGVKLDCEVNSTLLTNLFYNGAPLHDGGLIISRKGRIVMAGCMFPQDTTPRSIAFSEGAHTRHNAALGLCRVCDAMVIVVSEETGTVTVCLRNTAPQTMETPQQLIALLRKRYGMEETALNQHQHFRWLKRFIGGLNRR